MLDWLKDENFILTSANLVRIRKELGLKRLEASREAREHMDDIVRRLIEQEAGKRGAHPSLRAERVQCCYS